MASIPFYNAMAREASQTGTNLMQLLARKSQLRNQLSMMQAQLAQQKSMRELEIAEQYRRDKDYQDFQKAMLGERQDFQKEMFKKEAIHSKIMLGLQHEYGIKRMDEAMAREIWKQVNARREQLALELQNQQLEQSERNYKQELLNYIDDSMKAAGRIVEGGQVKKTPAMDRFITYMKGGGWFPLKTLGDLIKNPMAVRNLLSEPKPYRQVGPEFVESQAEQYSKQLNIPKEEALAYLTSQIPSYAATAPSYMDLAKGLSQGMPLWMVAPEQRYGMGESFQRKLFGTPAGTPYNIPNPPAMAPVPPQHQLYQSFPGGYTGLNRYLFNYANPSAAVEDYRRTFMR